LEQGIIEKVELTASLLLRVGVCSGKLEENCIFKSVLVLLLVEMGKQRVQNLSATLCCNYREQVFALAISAAQNSGSRSIYQPAGTIYCKQIEI
jgi:hypothetical protein